MAGPWEKYAAATPAAHEAAAGPWAKYSAPAPSPQAAPSRPDAFAGDDLLSNESMSRLAAGEQSTVTPSPEPSAFRGVKDYLSKIEDAAGRFNRAPATGGTGTLEAAGSLITGGIAAPILGTAESIALGTPPEESFARYTYQPRTESGKAQLGMLGAAVSPLTESGADIALAPLAGGESRVLGNPAKMPANARRPRVSRDPVPGQPAPVAGPVAAREATPANAIQAQRAAGLAEVPKPVPSLEELTTLRKDAYKRADDAGIVVRENSIKGVKTRLAAIAKKEGLNSKLHPDSSAALEEVLNSKGDLTLTEVETLRKIANDAKGSVKPADGRIGAKLVEEIDAYLDNLDDSDVVAGTPEKAKVLSEARALFTREKRSQTIARLVDRAETKAGAHYTQAGMEHALRGEFKSLALNEKELRRFSKAEQEAIKKIARGGKWENSLRNLGKFDPTSGGMAAFMSTLLAGGGAAPTGGVSLLLPVAAYAAKRKATQITSRKVSELDEMVRRGPAEANALAKQAAEKKRNALADF